MHSRRTLRWTAADNIAAAVIGSAGMLLAFAAFVAIVSKQGGV